MANELRRVVAIWLANIALKFTPDRDKDTLRAFIDLFRAMERDARGQE